MRCHHLGFNMCATMCIWWSPNQRYTTKMYRTYEVCGCGEYGWGWHALLLSVFIWTLSQNQTDSSHSHQTTTIFTLLSSGSVKMSHSVPFVAIGHWHMLPLAEVLRTCNVSGLRGVREGQTSGCRVICKNRNPLLANHPFRSHPYRLNFCIWVPLRHAYSV